MKTTVGELTEEELTRLKELKSKGWWRFVTSDSDNEDVALIDKVINLKLDEQNNDNSSNLVSFNDLALGSKFRYQGGDKVWILVEHYRKNGKDLHGTIVLYDERYMTKAWIGQPIATHIPESLGGDCPLMVEFVG